MRWSREIALGTEISRLGCWRPSRRLVSKSSTCRGCTSFMSPSRLVPQNVDRMDQAKVRSGPPERTMDPPPDLISVFKQALHPAGQFALVVAARGVGGLYGAAFFGRAVLADFEFAFDAGNGDS